ncbi:hypothetical protein TRFO_36348 [Tritrichomonas foetus]|uniref:Vacuolar sorting protein 39/Transforming growth factor beta receptor-associated zinc finger domain-containing protein n=1 Tax=Tritrichomonas foetus TaxID=1144522 RepID=A0A1J4JFF4_9EUKA|nr:hypothetical protein TRFO_36348 [Tritrichomonas foetus]|eukprot:OHS97401.1 hypothetical protein TRFO_36348 [Tritrichomonas foetus]
MIISISNLPIVNSKRILKQKFFNSFIDLFLKPYTKLLKMNHEGLNQVSYRKIEDFRSFNGQIIGIAHTNASIYVVTKKRELYGYPRSIFFSNGSISEKKMVDIVNSNIQKFSCITSNSRFHLLVQSNNTIYISAETNQGLQKFQPVAFDDNPGPIYNFVTICNNALLVALTNQKVIIYKYDGQRFISKGHVDVNKKVTDMIGSLTHFLIYDKSNYAIYDIDLQEIERNPLPPRFKIFHAIEGTNGIVALTQENQILNVDEPVFDTQDFAFSDDIIGFKIRLPYVYGISPKKFTMKTTVGPIEETIQNKFKYPIIDILDDYNVVIGNGNNLQLCKFYMNQMSPYIPHIFKFKMLMKDPKNRDSSIFWEYIINLCLKFDSNSFDNKKTLSEMYLEYSESLITSRQYAKAFEMFKLSGKHPFIMIHNFRLLLYSTNQDAEFDFLSLATEDCNKYIELLQEAEKAINLAITKRASGQPNESEVNDVIRCRTNCLLHFGQPFTPLTYETTRDTLDNLLQWVEKSLDKSHETLEYLPKFLFSLKGAKINSRDEGIYELQAYIKNLLMKEKDPTCIKIYYTILIECYAIKMPVKLEEFIKENNPLFFDVAAAALKTSAPEDFRKICRLYNRHDAALKPLLDAVPVMWDNIIVYIRETNNFIEIGEKYFPIVFSKMTDKQKEKSVEMFFSELLADPEVDKNVKAEQVNRILQIIQENCEKYSQKSAKNQQQRSKNQQQGQIDEECALLQKKFLEFAIYECKIMTGSVHWKLIKLFLGLIAPTAKFYAKLNSPAKYIQISLEKEPIKSYRSGLLKILEFSDSYKTQETLDAIISVSERLIEERIAVLKRATPPLIQEAVDLISRPNIPIEVAIDFCDSVYSEIDKNVYNLLFYAYHQQKKSQDSHDDTDKFIKILLNMRADNLKLKDIVENIPPFFKICEMVDFLSSSTTKSVNNLRFLKLKNILLEKTIEIKKTQLQQLKKGKVVISHCLKCIICGKKIGDSVFVALGDNTVAHIACRLSSDLY